MNVVSVFLDFVHLRVVFCIMLVLSVLYAIQKSCKSSFLLYCGKATGLGNLGGNNRSLEYQCVGMFLASTCIC